MLSTDSAVAATPASLPLAPRARGWPILGVAWHMRVDPLTTMRRAAAELGDTIYLKLGPYRATLFRNPEHIKHIFIDNAANYSKQTRGYEKSRLVLGDGLVTSEGELWQRQRRIANPAFGRQRVAGFASTMTAATQEMLDRWQKRERCDEPIDVFVEMMRTTLHIAVQTLLGITGGPQLAELSRAVSIVLEHTNNIITNPLSLPVWVPTPKNLAFHRAIGQLDQFVYSTIHTRREHAAAQEDKTDLLAMLMSSRDEQSGQGMSDKQLRDEAVTILIAGHETVANAMTWALHLLAEHPQVQDELREELDRVLAGGTPTMEDIPNLRFTRMVVDESMRLYPPAWMIGRAAREADAIGGYRVDKGSFVLASPYMTHRHPGLWDKPDEFDPHRFGDGRSEKLPKFAYLPFGGGQRFCIGGTFALIEAVLMLACIAQRVRLGPVAGARIEPYAMITLRPRYGMPLRIIRIS